MRRNDKLDELVTGAVAKPAAGGKDTQKKKKMRKQRREARRKVRHALKTWRLEQRELLEKYSRQQLLRSLTPLAGQVRDPPKKAEGKTKKEAKVQRNVGNSSGPRQLIFTLFLRVY